MKSKKVFSILLSLALVLSSLPMMILSAAETDTAHNYYVLSGGTGNGLTPETPVDSVQDAIANINAACLSAGDTVNVYIIQHDTLNVTSSGHNVTSWAHGSCGDVQEHSAKLIVQPYSTDGTTYLAQNENYRSGAMIFKGPTELRNIKFVGGSDSEMAMLFNGNSVTFGEGVTYGLFDKSAGSIVNSPNGFWKTSFAYWGGAVSYSNELDVTVENALPNAIYVGDLNYGNTPVTYREDVTITYKNPSVNASLIWAPGNIFFKKNLNINIKDASGVQNTKASVRGIGGGTVTVDGGLQVIVNKDVPVTTDYTNMFAEVKGGIWYLINDCGADVIDFTDTKGQYTVKEGYAVKAVNDDTDEVIESTDGLLTLPAGTYTLIDNSYSGEETAHNYYVLSGGTGNGLTPETPVDSVQDAIAKINVAGLGAGDTVNVYIMQHDTLNVTSSGHNVTSWAHDGCGDVQAHSAKLIVQPYSTDGTTYLAQNENYRSGAMIFKGPTELRNIKFVGGSDSEMAMLFNGNSVTFGEGVTYGLFNKSAGSIVNSPNGFWKTSFAYWGGAGSYSNKLDVTVKNALPNAIYVGDLNYGSTPVTYREDVTITYDNPSVNASLIWAPGNIFFKKNLNINIKDASSVQNTKASVGGIGGGTVTVDGGLQVIVNKDVPVTTDYTNMFAEVKLGTWYLKNDSKRDIIDFTETKGQFTVKEGYAVKAVNDDTEEIIESADGLLTLPAGTYTLSTERDSNNYYVLSGVTGDGRTENTPAATVVDAIKSINEDNFKTGDTVNVFIMQNDDWDSAKGTLVGSSAGTPAHKITSWKEAQATVPAYTSKIVIQSYGEGINYLAMADELGINKSIQVGGPTEFKNIKIVSTRQIDTGLYFNGENVTLGEGTSFGYINNSQYNSDAAWDGIVHEINGFNESSLTAWAGGTYLKEMTAMVDTCYSRYLRIGANGGAATFNEDVNLIYNDPDHGAFLNWGSGVGSATTFNKNLNIEVRRGKVLDNIKSDATVTVNGGLQILAHDNVSVKGDISKLTNINSVGGWWVLENKSDIYDLISFTDSKGVYNVKSGYSVVATNKTTKAKTCSVDGVLTLAANAQYAINVIGDANNDDIVDIRDLIRSKKITVGVAENNGLCDFDGNDSINSSDIAALSKILLVMGGFNVREQILTGAENEANFLRSKILNANDSLTATGTTYYVAADGTTTADGTEADPWSVEKLVKGSTSAAELQSGDMVLFKRGDTFRLTDEITVTSGVKYGAYGTGAKPKLYGSANYADAEWMPTSEPNVWELTMPTSYCVGNIIFNHGEEIGYLRNSRSELRSDFDYYFDEKDGNGDLPNDTRHVYLYLSYGNPAEAFDDIEIPVSYSIFYGVRKSDITIDNLDIKYSGGGVNLEYGTARVNITNCEIAYIGGVFVTGNEAAKIRGGNAVGFWGSTSDVNIENNWIYEQYDTAISPQGDGENLSITNFTVNENLIEKSYWSYEIFTPSNGTVTNHNITNNIMRLAGYNWSANQRLIKDTAAHFIVASNMTNCFANSNVSGNIFDCSASYFAFFQGQMEMPTGLTFSGNTYYQHNNINNFAIAFTNGNESDIVRVGNQAEFEAAISTIEASPILVKWLG